jgi:hydroxypyruvate reductase
MAEDVQRGMLKSLWQAALKGADAGSRVAAHLPALPRGRAVVVGAGKAALAMAGAVEAAWCGAAEGLVVTQAGGRPAALTRIRLVEASHPLPGLEAQAAAAETLVRASMLTADDLLLVLLSGGGSALWPAPRRPLTLEGKRAITQGLLRSGAPIAEINTVRKHLSRIKGGRLAAASGPCPIVALAVSDVPGDDPGLIASGPVSPDASTRNDARSILARRGIPLSPEIEAVLDNPASETPKPGNACFDRVDYRIVLRPADALAETARQAADLGYEPIMLGDALEGEARVVAGDHAARAQGLKAQGRRAALISGGELTVTMTGGGTGGPSREYALGLALSLDGAAGICAFAADSDGLDGSPDAAGAMVFPSTLKRGRAKHLDANRSLDANDSGGYFGFLGDAIVTGPTGTNVNDVRVILIDPVS